MKKSSPKRKGLNKEAVSGPSKKNAPADPVDVESLDLERMKSLVSDSPGISKYALEKGGTAFTPTQEGAIKSRSFKIMDEQITMQMANIMEQIHVLAKQAEALKDRRLISEIIYRAKMSFEPLVGDIYYLYATPQGKVLSILSPQDFGDQKLKEQQFEFYAKVRLLADCTWDILEKAKTDLEK